MQPGQRGRDGFTGQRGRDGLTGQRGRDGFHWAERQGWIGGRMLEGQGVAREWTGIDRQTDGNGQDRTGADRAGPDGRMVEWRNGRWEFQVAIIGSANINDRSLNQSMANEAGRDSEVIIMIIYFAGRDSEVKVVRAVCAGMAPRLKWLGQCVLAWLRG